MADEIAASEDDIDLATLSDEDLVTQMHDDLTVHNRLQTIIIQQNVNVYVGK